ncbi:MAG TPA: ABC transporter permease [Blastocatellia bacterium]|nr:ABC transporter permease [Blastocatellia bacterium]
MNTFWRDLRYSARVLAKSPAFTLIAVVTLALGIGANTAIFSVLYALVLRPLPYREPDRLVMLAERDTDGSRSSISYPNYEDWRSRAQSFEEMASVRGDFFTLTGAGNAEQVQGRTVNWNFFRVLGVQPQLGRPFAVDDDRYGAPRTAIISNRLWQDRLGRDQQIIGKTLVVNREPYEVIGVLPPGFEYFREDGLYLPIGLFLQPGTGMTDRGSSFGLRAVARLKTGVTLAEASVEMRGIAAQLEREYPAVNGGLAAIVEPLHDVISEGVRQSLWVLLGAVGFVLLIACVNVANLLLVRAADRRRDIALRLSLGASRGRIIGQLLSESLLIALLGAAAGVLIGRWMLDGLLALAPGNIPQLGRVSLDVPVLLFTLGISALASLLSGLFPALHAVRTDINAFLKEAGRSTPGPGRDLTRRTLLVAEVSLALVLLTGAGLLVRSMARLMSVDPGFNPDNLLTMRVMLPNTVYDQDRARTYSEECLARLGTLPGVRSAAITISLPIDGSFWDSAFFAGDKPVPARAELPEAAFVSVSANYFDAMGIQVLKGRGFTSADNGQSAKVTVVNETLARSMWPGEDPIGKRLKNGFPEYDAPWREVVGVVRDVKLNGIERQTPMQAYLPFAQEPWTNFSIVVRTTADAEKAAGAVGTIVQSIDKDVPIFSMRSMDQLLSNSTAQRRLILTLLVSFAALALVLAVVGIYGVASYSVTQRTHELGVRIALGAQPGDVLRLILGQGLKLVLAGVAIGLPAAIALTSSIEALLFDVQPNDPLTLTGMVVILTLAAVLACWIPARRATRVDPMISLRCE